MRPSELLKNLRSLGVELSLNGEKLHVEAPSGVLTPELREELRIHKLELLSILRYGTPAAWLYLHIGREVRTPGGEGTLWQVFRDRAGVVINGRVRFFELGEVEFMRGPRRGVGAAVEWNMERNGGKNEGKTGAKQGRFQGEQDEHQAGQHEQGEQQAGQAERKQGKQRGREA